MGGSSSGQKDDGALFSAAVKSVRRHRGMSTSEVADAMNMPLRTYERFEAGTTRLNLDHLHRFAEATRSDPQGILFALAAGSPDLARRCADNQFGTILLIGLQKFDAALGDDIHKLDARDLIGAVIRMFDALAARLSQADPAHSWLAEGAVDLRSRRPRPGR